MAGAAVLAWSLVVFPPLLLSVAVHKGVWNVAPVIEATGQEGPTIALIGLTLALLAAGSLRRQPPKSLIRLGLVVALFVAYGAVGAVLGGGLNSTAKVLRLALFLGWGFLLAWLIGVDRRATIMALALTVAGATVIAFASAPNWIGTGIPTVFGENRIIFGRSVGVGAVVALGTALTGRMTPAWRALLALVGLALAVVTVASASRGAFVSISAAGVIMLLLPLAGRGVRYRVLALGMFIGLVIVAVLAVSGSIGFTRLLSLADPGGDMSTLLRAQALQYSFDQWVASPIFGIGLRDLQLDVSTGQLTQALAYPHNMLVETLSQTGLVGLALIATAIGLPLAMVLRNAHLRKDPVVAALVGVLVFYFVSAQFSGDLQINRYVWTFAFFLAATPAWFRERS